MNQIFSPKLPQGYCFSNNNILPSEIISLRLSVGWDGDSVERWQSVIEISLGTIGVRNIDKELIGVAFLAGNLRHAVICDLVVNPTHQNRGIGEAIMAKIYEKIDEVGASFVYVELSKENPFKQKMIQSGFRETGDSLFWQIQK